MMPVTLIAVLVSLLAVAHAARVVNLDLLPDVVASAQQLEHHDDSSVCEDWEWRKYSLKLIKEIPVSGLFEDLQGMDKFEASGLTVYKGRYIMVFDNSHTLGVMDKHLNYRDPNNALVGEPEEESQFEAITVRSKTDTVLAIREISLDGSQPEVIELKLDDDLKATKLRSCAFDFDISGANKGFEGATYYDGGDRGEFLLGLCEGNYCEGNDERGQESGNGRIVVGKLDESGDKCVWKVHTTVKLPKTADFLDYSEIAINKNARVAITSQENSSIWIGHIDYETFEMVDEGVVLHLPRGAHCGQMYCNVEGVVWVDSQRLLTVTDAAKASQPWQCSAKDQSVQVFALPKNKYLDAARLLDTEL